MRPSQTEGIILRGTTGGCNLISVVLLAVAAAAAGADTSSVTARVSALRPPTRQMTCQLSVRFNPSSGNDAIVQVVVPTHFSSVSQVCFTFHVSGDLVDPGEDLSFTARNWNGAAFGFESAGPDSISQNTGCLAAGFHDTELATFLDGRETLDVSCFGGRLTWRVLTS